MPCMPVLHKKELKPAHKSIISHTADAHGGFSSQFRRISCSPLEVFDLHNYKGPGAIRRPSFFTRNNFLDLTRYLREITLVSSVFRLHILVSTRRFPVVRCCSPLEVFAFKTVGRGEIQRPFF